MKKPDKKKEMDAFKRGVVVGVNLANIVFSTSFLTAQKALEDAVKK